MKATAFVLLLALLCSVAGAAIYDSRPAGLTGETWQFGPLNRWAYTHIREFLPTKDIPNDSMHVRSIPGIETAGNDLKIELDGKAV